MRHTITELVTGALERLAAQGVIPGEGPWPFRVERPREKEHGDFSTNAAMVLAKAARIPPRVLAERIVAALPADQEVVDRVEVAGPGFINFAIAPPHLRQLIHQIRREGVAYGRGDVGHGQRVQVEFVSANPTGPMHVGHGRGAVMGDVIARLLEASGFGVEREYYVNDAGAQVKVLGRSVLLRYRELAGEAVEIPADCYPGEYVIEIARALRQRDGDRWLDASRSQNLDDPPGEVIAFAIAENMADIQETLGLLQIGFDHFFSERSLHETGGVERAVARLEEQGLIYEGVLEPPKGKALEDWEPRPQLLFRATGFGDEVDRPLRKSDGSFTYFAADIAYHWHKVERGFHRLVNVWGADHGGYVKRVRAAVEALTGKGEVLDVKLVQMVNLTRGGQPVRMSKRAGTFITLREVVDEVGPAAVRFWFLTRAGNSQLDFDLELAVSQSNDNPVYYVQYAHARLCSVWRQMAEKGLELEPGALERADLGRLEELAELDLIRLLGLYPETVEGAALAHEPHRIPYYLLDLAAAFHTYYNSHRILEADVGLRIARLALCDATRQVLANGLTLLGIEPAERM